MIKVTGKTTSVEDVWVDPRQLYESLTNSAITTLCPEQLHGAVYINLDYTTDEIIATFGYNTDTYVKKPELRLKAEDIGVGLFDQVTNLLVGRDEFLRIEQLHGEIVDK